MSYVAASPLGWGGLGYLIAITRSLHKIKSHFMALGFIGLGYQCCELGSRTFIRHVWLATNFGRQLHIVFMGQSTRVLGYRKTETTCVLSNGKLVGLSEDVEAHSALQRLDRVYLNEVKQ